MKTIRELDFMVPIRTVSELNARSHWRVVYNRKKEQKELVTVAMHNALRGRMVQLPCLIKLTRVAPRSLDSHDNLRSSLKFTVDAICQKLGIDDASDQVSFEYHQMPMRTLKSYGVKIEIKTVGANEQCQQF